MNGKAKNGQERYGTEGLGEGRTRQIEEMRRTERNTKRKERYMKGDETFNKRR